MQKIKYEGKIGRVYILAKTESVYHDKDFPLKITKVYFLRILVII